ncbi:MAG: hypothetical protein EA418_01125 [Wenzhouxiangellaceae bacterium]|nr:MAG: hypothetical protein EA418_01125 [Wenzhouxiangellaceae bacterium]
MGYRFGEFELFPELRELRCGDKALRAEPRVFDLLCFLVEHRERAVAKDELIRSVWGHSALTDAGLSQTVGRLRRLLGDSSDQPRFVATVHGFGYRWIAEVKAAQPNDARSTHQPDNDKRPPARLGRKLLVALGLLAVAGALILPAMLDREHPARPEASAPGSATLLILPLEQAEADLLPAEALRGLAELLRQGLSDRSERLVVLSTRVGTEHAEGRLEQTELGHGGPLFELALTLDQDAQDWLLRLRLRRLDQAGSDWSIDDRLRAPELEIALARLTARLLILLDGTDIDVDAIASQPLMARRAQAMELARIGRRSESRAIFEGLLEKAPDDPELLLGLGTLDCQARDRAPCFQRLVPLTTGRHDARTAVLSRIALADFHLATGEGEAADHLIAELAELDQPSLDPSLRAEIASVRSHRAFVAGRYAEAREQELLAQRMQLLVGEVRGAMVAQIRAAGIAGLGGDRLLAISQLEQAASQMRSMGNSEGQAVAWLVASVFHIYDGRLALAWRSASEAATIAEQANAPPLLAEALERQGQVLAGRGESAAAIDHITRARALAEANRDQQRVLTTRLRLASLKDDNDSLDVELAELFDQVDQRLSPIVQAGMFSELAVLASRSKEDDLAERAASALARLARQWPDHQLMPAMQAWTAARRAALAGDCRSALEQLPPAWVQRRAGIIELEALFVLKADCLLELGRLQEARELLADPGLVRLEGVAGRRAVHAIEAAMP